VAKRPTAQLAISLARLIFYSHERIRGLAADTAGLGDRLGSATRLPRLQMLAFEFFAERWVRQDYGVRLASPVHPEAHSYAALNTRVARQWRPIFSQYRLQLASLGFIRSARFQEASILAARILVVRPLYPGLR